MDPQLRNHLLEPTVAVELLIGAGEPWNTQRK
jgi:hypothetical protein